MKRNPLCRGSIETRLELNYSHLVRLFEFECNSLASPRRRRTKTPLGMTAPRSHVGTRLSGNVIRNTRLGLIGLTVTIMYRCYLEVIPLFSSIKSNIIQIYCIIG